MAVYAPRQGDIMAITFDPQSDHTQKGRRPALVVSKNSRGRVDWSRNPTTWLASSRYVGFGSSTATYESPHSIAYPRSIA